MHKLEEFKDFVRQNSFVKAAVDANRITWQKAYETYDLFGASAEDWTSLKAAMEPKIEVIDPPQQQAAAAPALSNNYYDVVGLLSSIDYNKVSNTIDQLQKMVGVVRDLTSSEEPKEGKARKIFKRFND